MGRSLKVIISAILIVSGMAGAVVCGILLAQQGLDRAEKWVSINVGLASVVLAAAGVWLGWLTWRHTTSASPSIRPVNAGGMGAVAVGGTSGGHIATEVSGAVPSASADTGDGVNAAGAGAVAVGGDSAAPIHTKVTGPGTTP
ncbi:hypothetical protein ACIBO1_22485 [Micromonospora sp. NPDC049903]|uniref:hypothetical protein n=1 Tax=Micromonospora sp. NPDC049903 TaxID=3364276 RepID=UPI0037B14E59